MFAGIYIVPATLPRVLNKLMDDGFGFNIAEGYRAEMMTSDKRISAKRISDTPRLSMRSRKVMFPLFTL